MIKKLRSSGFIWGTLLFLSACTQAPVSEDPDKHSDGTFKTTLVTGRFSGYPDYKDWVVFLSGFNYRSVIYRVEVDGDFHIKAVNIPPGSYRLFFGKRSKNMGSMKIRIDSLRTHLGTIGKGY